MGVAVTVAVGVAVTVGVAVGVAVTVAVGVGVTVAVGVAVTVAVTVAVGVGVRVVVTVGVGVAVRVGVAVEVGSGTEMWSVSPRHFATVPGTASALEVQRPVMLLSQLTMLGMSTSPSLLRSTQVMLTPKMFRKVETPCSMSPQTSAPPSAS